MHQNLLNHKSAQFATERDTSSILFEVKKTRAIWDSGLSVPGTNRRGGWRCPPGLAFGGQITDRFGRNCGYGLVRRLGNAMNDLGERMNEGDKKRRERRIAKLGANINQPGMVERAAGRVADALETDKKPARRVRTGNIDAVKPVKPAKPVARAAKGDRKKPVAVDTVSNTPVPAGAPNIGENLNQYKRRKYNEHQKRVREIREGGGKAGMLRYPEWDKFHGSVIEENWNKKNGVPKARKRVVNERKPKDKISTIAVPAGAPNKDESLSDYMTRKFNEHQAEVRKIRENGGKAGHLTRPQWDEFHGPIVEANWNKKNGIVAKKPVRPRAPKAKIADAKKQVTAEKPAVKKAAVKKPAVKKPAVKKAAAPKPAVKDETKWGDKILESLDSDDVLSATNIASLMKKANIEQSIIDATVKKQLDREADAAKQFAMRQKQLEDGLISPSEYQKWVDTFIQDIAPVKDGIKDRLNSFIKEVEDNKDQDEIKRKLERLLTGNRLQVANVVVADLAKKFNAAQQAKKPVATVDSAPAKPKAANAGKNLAKVLRVAGVRKHGKEGRIAVGDGLPPKPGELPVPHLVKSKMTSTEAIQHLKNGGDLAVVPHQFWFTAIQANLKTPNNPNGTWATLAKKGGMIGDTFIFVKLDAKGKKTNSGWVFKAASNNDNLHELMAWNLAGAHGFDIEGAHMDGQIGARNSVVLPFAQNHIPSDWKEIKGNGNNFDRDAIDNLDDKAYPQRLAHYLHNYLLDVRDRHTGNGFAKVFAKPSGEKVAHIIPIDQGWAFKKGNNPPANIRGYDFGMDRGLLNGMGLHLMQINDKKEQAKQRKAVIDAMDGIIENAQKVMKMDSDDVYAWVKSMYPEGQDVSEAQVKHFWNSYNKMVKQLTKERNGIVRDFIG